MIHSFLIVGGTVDKRRLEARDLMLEKKLEARSWKNQTSSFKHPFEPPASSLQLRSAVDVTVLEPEEDKQTISIDQVRDLQHQLSLKPYAAKFKTGIILEAQRMTIEAQNALLKTLEEPPAHSILILTAPSTKNLLPTTVSRCQIVRLPSEIDLDPESEGHQQHVEDFLQILQQGRGERLEWAERNSSNLKSQISNLKLFDVWISVLRDLLLNQQGCQNLVLNSFKPFTPFKPQILTEALEKTIKTKNLIASTNISPRLALEVLLLNLPIFSATIPLR